MSDKINRLKFEIADQADEISQLDNKSADYSLELLDAIEGLKENITNKARGQHF
jgi:hypothetical protein